MPLERNSYDIMVPADPEQLFKRLSTEVPMLPIETEDHPFTALCTTIRNAVESIGSSCP
jgi:hypothetical protein